MDDLAPTLPRPSSRREPNPMDRPREESATGAEEPDPDEAVARTIAGGRASAIPCAAEATATLSSV